MKSYFLFVFLFCAVSLSSCKENFETFDIGKEETVVYGILNIKDSTHYLKVFKTFVANPDQLEYHISDENIYYYDPEEIDVYMEEWQNETLSRTITFSPFSDDTLSTPFYNDKSYYSSNSFLKANSKYLLKVFVKNSNKTVTAELETYGGRDIGYQIYNETHRKMAISAYHEFTIEEFDFNRDWTEDYYWEVVHRFLYFEIKNNDTVPTFIEWNQIPSEYVIFGDIRIGQFKENFYRYLRDHIPFKEGVKRIAIGLDQMVLFTTDATQDYITNAKTPKSDFYSVKRIDNIENGIGFIGWQYHWVNFAQSFTQLTTDSLSMMDSTRFMNFRNSNGIYPN